MGSQVPPADLYRIAVEEYRFQVNLNWQRVQYMLGLNALILVFAVGQHDSQYSILAYIAGAGTAVVSMLWQSVQHGYYRVARDKVLALGEELEVGDSVVGSTLTARGITGRHLRVRSLLTALLGLFAVLNIAGIVLQLR